MTAFVDRIQEMVGHEYGPDDRARMRLSRRSKRSMYPVTDGKTLGIITPYQPVGDKNVRLFFNDAGYEIKTWSACAAKTRTTRSRSCPSTRSWTP